MNQYELVILFHPDLEIDVDAPVAKIEKLIDNAGGKVVKRDNWGKKRLAYRIRRLDFAVYIYFELSLPPAHVRDFEHNLGLAEEVLRHLLVSKPPAPTKPAPKKPAKAKAAETQSKEEEK